VAHARLAVLVMLTPCSARHRAVGDDEQQRH
jgi:hypothetical protein